MIDPAVALAFFAGLVLLAALAFWPRKGVVARFLRLSRTHERIRLEDAVKHVYTCERRGQPCSLESMAGRLEISTGHAAEIVSSLASLGLLRMEGAHPRLTGEGRATALRIVRTHRLWERWLADRTGVPAEEWHEEADRMEHALSPEETERLAARLGNPRWDPHGDPIPTVHGELPPSRATTLVDVPAGRSVEIVHLEDEPREIYQGLVADGLAPGGRLDVVEASEAGITVHAGGRTWRIDPVAAANVTVARLPAGERAEGPRETLLDVPLGESATVVALSRACRGAQRRRLLDLGLVPGTLVRAELSSAGGDPVAYDIRGALIALRREQAAWVLVERDAAARPEDAVA